jgi:3-hydroxyisobutyrate dehydrogenase-like beta-hydroxyacid dehydrogenase
MERRSPADELRAGVVGLGVIGGGVAISLARRGRNPVVHDIRPDAAGDLPGVRAVAPSAKEVAQASDIVLLAVVDAAQARDALTGPAGVLAGAHEGTVVVLLCTVTVEAVHELASLCGAVGVPLLDCGVTPGTKAAENGMIAILGGDRDVIDYARPVLEDWAKQIVHCGPLGTGMAAKIGRNVVTYGSWRAAYEGWSLAVAAGVEPEKLFEIIRAADPEGMNPLLLLSEYRSGAALPHWLTTAEHFIDKDLHAAQKLGARLGVDVPVVDAARRTRHETVGPALSARKLPARELPARER